MREKYVFLILCCLICQLGLAQNMDRQRSLSNISNLELASADDFAVFEDSLNFNRSVLNEEDLVVLYQKAVNQSKIIKHDSLFFHYSGLLAYSNVMLLKYDELFKTSKASLEYAKAIKDTSAIITSLSRIGTSYSMQNDSLIKALDFQMKAFNLAKTYGNKALVNFASNNLSNYYNSIGREEDAISLLKNSINENKGIETPAALSSLGNNYIILSGLEFKDTLENINLITELEEVVYLSENHQQFKQKKALKALCSHAYFHLFNYYIKKKANLKKGEYYYQKLQNAEMSIGYQKYIASFLYAISKKDLAAAKKFIKKENEDIYKELYFLYALDYYKLTGNFERQLYYSNLLKEAKIDKLKSDKVNLNNFTNLQLENGEQTKELALLQQNIKSKNIQRKYLFSISFLLGGLLLSILYAFLQIRKRNKFLNEQKSIIGKQAIELKAVNEQKSIFFANVAHEFQTPLSIMIGLAKKVKSLDSIEDAKPLLPIIIRNGTQLSELTTQILDLTKNEETSYPLDQGYFHLGELIQYQVHELQHLADSKNITIYLQNTLEKQVIFSDVYKFKTIVKNLISNAIKFSPLNSAIKLTLNSVDKENIALTISDNGKGIPQEDLTTIFDRFYQSNNKKEEGGFGIGLAICKEYTKALGGHIEAQSILGKGSQFVLKIPTNVNGQLIEDASIQKFPIKEYTKESILTNQTNQDKSILIIEDNLDFCKYLSSILASRYQLTFFHNGYDALDYLKSESPDLIITDWMLPEMNGLELVKRLKESLENKQIPILMLTARGMLTDQLKALREGIDDFLVKNFEEEILIQRVENLITPSSSNGLAKPSPLHNTDPSFSDRILKNISKQDQEWLLQFESSIMPRLQAFELNLDEIALMMNMSVTHLGRKMKSITGITPKKYIQEMRFWEARRMLELRLVDSVKAACLSVGFKDQSHFSKKFKDKFGSYPSDFL